MLNTLEWNLHGEVTEEESVELMTEDEQHYVAPLNYQESGNEAEVKSDKYLDSDSNRSSEEEIQLEQEDKEEVNDKHRVSYETETEDEEEQPKKREAKAPSSPMTKKYRFKKCSSKCGFRQYRRLQLLI